jgi:hypothetical protein
VAETLNYTIQVPINDEYMMYVRAAAQRENRSLAGFVRHLILLDLQHRGMVDDNFAIIEGSEREHEEGPPPTEPTAAAA